jgi:antitoxin component of MazEF toxin-antitoxin module
MGFKTKIQLIQRKGGSQQWYINFPSACAQMMDFVKGETAEWVVARGGELVLRRESGDGRKRKS